MNPWWRGASVYQVYIRSFCDSNGDGQGDLPGLISKLDYIAALGVDAIWLSPLHPSPNRDWGYDVADYEGVQPDYGTLADFQALVGAAHARGLKLLLDEVLAHTSDEHAWFAASRDGDAGKRDWPKKDWYVWADPKDDGTVPNNWLSVFGGPAWAYQPARRQYYHHKFLRQQPKLNWQNAAAREAALSVLDLWLERGVDGFRLDVANAFLHDATLKDNPAIPATARDAYAWSAAANMQRHIHDSNLEESRPLLDAVRRRVDAFDDRFVFGEFSEEFERSGCYLPPDQGLHAGYNFALLLATDAAAIRAHLETLERFPEHWPCISFSNHDVLRTVTRFGGDGTDNRVARLYLALLLALRGTVLIYQGEELGLPEVDLKRDQLRDPVGDLYYPLFKGRDGCRTPMPWDGAAPNLGFSSGTPWLPLGPAHAALGVAAQEGDPDSTLAFAKRLLARRRASRALKAGTQTLLQAPLPLIALVREAGDERLLCVFNLGQETLRFDDALLSRAEPLDWGCGWTHLSPAGLTLGPLAAWFARI
ncbi:MAG TPA: alpha-amylase family glycosyl hydrolase [Rhizomicrobium sp.]|nr:alpha-amylase family glycosyl hydrolase [Rhizomicrobium sp.]